jgi:ubiquitin C-terminal hydrolase
METRTQCSTCGYESHPKEQKLQVLDVRLPGGDCNLQQLIKECLEESTLDPSNLWDGCGCAGESEKEQYTLTEIGAPPLLCISLTRHTWDEAEGRLKRVAGEVNFPMGGLLVGGGEYSCRAVVCHNGETPTTGHYVAFCKSGRSWLKFDDLEYRVCEDCDRMATPVTNCARCSTKNEASATSSSPNTYGDCRTEACLLYYAR